MWSDESDRPHNSLYYGSSGEPSSSSSPSPSSPPVPPLAVVDHGLKATASASASASNLEHYLHASPYDREPSDYDHDSERHLSFLHSADTQSQADNMSDDHDMDDGGAPVHYGDIANILTQGMEVDYDSDHGDGISVSHAVLAGLPPPPPLMNPVPHYGAFQAQYALQYPGSIPHTHPAVMQPPPQPPHGPPEDGQEANNDIAHHVPLHHTQTTHANLMNNPNTVALGPENYNLADFIRVWAWQNGVWQGVSRERGRYPWLDRISPQISKDLSRVDYNDLEGDSCDVQGVNWDDLGVTRSEARERRLLTYKNYVNIPRSDRWQVRNAFN